MVAAVVPMENGERVQAVRGRRTSCFELARSRLAVMKRAAADRAGLTVRGWASDESGCLDELSHSMFGLR